MSARPRVSVVMGVFNGARTVQASIDSVLSQSGCSFELVIVDDGSTDATPQILASYLQRDPRVRVITQPNQGLTRALMTGCTAAEGEFIARQDCGDVSLPGRLRSQLQHLMENPAACMVAAGARFVGPAGEVLQVVAYPGRSLHDGLSVLDLKRLQGPPHHGATMFRTAAYRAAGGYRPQFVVAQDIDLWLRLAEVGLCLGLEEVGYAAAVEASGISSRRRADQHRMAALAIDCAKARRATGSDDDVLRAAAVAAALKRPDQPVSRSEMARHLYFVGCNLRRTDPSAARRYFRQAVVNDPLFLRAVWRSVLG